MSGTLTFRFETGDPNGLAIATILTRITIEARPALYEVNVWGYRLYATGRSAEDRLACVARKTAAEVGAFVAAAIEDREKAWTERGLVPRIAAALAIPQPSATEAISPEATTRGGASGGISTPGAPGAEATAAPTISRCAQCGTADTRVAIYLGRAIEGALHDFCGRSCFTSYLLAHGYVETRRGFEKAGQPIQRP